MKRLLLVLVSAITVFLIFKSSAPDGTKGVKILTFTEDIAPIIRQNCITCHHEGGGAPFPLTNYREVVKRLRFIKEVTQTRYMPPWKADPHYRSFANERGLTEKEINLIQTWSEQGTQKGEGDLSIIDPAEVKAKLTAFYDDELSMSKPHIVPGDNSDLFVFYGIFFERSESHPIEAIEFIPGNRKVVHHANISFYSLNKSIDLGGKRALSVLLDLDNPKHVALFNIPQQNHLYATGWVPGASPMQFPEGIGFDLPKNGFLLLGIHYAPTAIEEEDLSSIKIRYAKKPIRNKIQAITIGSSGIGEFDKSLDIAPNEIKTLTVSLNIPRDIYLFSANPHMHLLGRKFEAHAISPNGESIPLVRIKDWDFNWQEFYQFKEPLKIEAGSTIHATGTFDNTEDNPFNPNYPPIPVTIDGMKTEDEMLAFMIFFTLEKP